MTETEKQALIAEHRKIQMIEIPVFTRSNQTYNDCTDELRVRRFCAGKGLVLPGDVEIEVIPAPEETPRVQWYIKVFENPNRGDPA